MSREGHVYVMANERNTTVYIGVTSDLVRWVAEHKLKLVPGFTSQYNCTKLVYYEVTDSIQDALSREKQLKNWRRAWKDQLVAQLNPGWADLSARIGVTPSVLAHVAKAARPVRASPGSRDPGASPG